MSSMSSRTFERRILMTCIPSNIISGLFIYFYTISVIQLDISLWGIAFVVVASIVMVAQIFMAPVTNLLVARRLSRRLEQWQNGELSFQQRTELLCDVQAFPKKKQLEAYWYFFIGTGVLAFGYSYFLKVSWLDVMASIAICLFSTYIAGVLNLFSSIKLCSEYAKKIVGQGVDQHIVRQRGALGLNFTQSFGQFVIAPLVFTTVLFVLTFIIKYLGNGRQMGVVQMRIVYMVVVVNIVSIAVLAIAFFASVLRSSRMLQEAMEHITGNDIFTVEPLSTDMANEISYNMYLANNVITLFQSVLMRIWRIGQSLLSPIDELQKIAGNAAASSCQQSCGVQEMLVALNENENLMQEMNRKLGEVTAVATSTTGNVEQSFSILVETAAKMEEISKSNLVTSTGICTLGERINGVWNIVNRISAIAEQTRIIGFNAELRASEAGETGYTFLIIANEIKRLAGSIMDAVVLIKERISEIQASSDSLIISSESGTERVREGSELSSKLSQKIADIKVSAEITQESAEDIASIIREQAQEIQKVVVTAGQISSGMEEVSTSMALVSDIANQLTNIAHRLQHLNQEIIRARKEMPFDGTGHR